MKIKVTRQGESINLEADEGMRGATNEQILSYVNEALKPEPRLTANDFQVERTQEGLLVHPTPTYG